MREVRNRSGNPLRAAALVLLGCTAFCLTVEAQASAPGAEPAWSKGPADTRVVLEVFNDYQCPPCGTFNPELNRVLAAFPRDVRGIYRNFPLRIHQHALAAARAAEAAGQQGRFLEMKEMLFARVDQWAVSRNPNRLFRIYARRLKLNRTKFRRDMLSQAVADRIEADKKRGEALNVTGTPTIFMSGRKLNFEDTNFERLSVMIREELKRE